MKKLSKASLALLSVLFINGCATGPYGETIMPMLSGSVAGISGNTAYRVNMSNANTAGGYYGGYPGYYPAGLPTAYNTVVRSPYMRNNYRYTGCYYRGARNPPECPRRYIPATAPVAPIGVK